jgi:hypothetical protein
LCIELVIETSLCSNMFLQDVNNLLKGCTAQHCSFTQLLSYIGRLFCLTTVTTHQLTDTNLAPKEHVSVRSDTSVSHRKTFPALSLYVVSK